MPTFLVRTVDDLQGIQLGDHVNFEITRRYGFGADRISSGSGEVIEASYDGLQPSLTIQLPGGSTMILYPTVLSDKVEVMRP